MTAHVDDLLSRARFVHEPYTQADIDAAEQRLAARIADPPPGLRTSPTGRTGRKRCGARLAGTSRG